MGKAPTAEASCEIDAPIDTVWGLLTDVTNYDAWNPFVVHVQAPDGGTTPGALMKFQVRWVGGGSAKSKERVVSADAPTANADGVKTARWVYDFVSWMATVGMIRARRTQALRQEPGGKTLYTSHEVFSGWGSGGVPLGKVKAGFEAQAQALKASAEGLQPSKERG